MTATASERPLRADARRNYDALVVAARDVFTERGSEASLEEIARRAGVGIGTLYRHFPCRLNLLEAVYRDDVARLEALAAEGADADPWDQLVRWVDRLVFEYMTTKKALFAELTEAVGRDPTFMSGCRESMRRAATEVLERAQKAGVVRTDIDAPDLMRLVHGVTVGPVEDSAQLKRLVGVMLDGLRTSAQSR